MDLLFKLDRNNYKSEILEEYTDNIFIDFKKATNYNNIQQEIKKSTNKDTIYIYKKSWKIMTNNKNYFCYLCNFDIENAYSIQAHDINTDDNNFFIYGKRPGENKIENLGCITNMNTRYKNISYNMYSSNIYNIIKSNDYCKREDILYNIKLKTISLLFDFLENNGNFFFALCGLCNNNIIEFYYILAYMFEYCIIYNATYIFCYNFNSILKKDDFNKIINKKFSISPKFNLDKLINYINYNIEYSTKKLLLLIQNKEDEFLELLKNEIFQSVKYFNNDILDDIKKNFNMSIIEDFKRIYINGEIVKISSCINSEEGKIITAIIKKYKFKKCLEIGMACGVSAFYILSNKKTKLISIDPYQDSQWKNYGIKLLKELKLDKRHKLYQLKSYDALPRLVKKNKIFDFIFIDGFHTFDYTLIDFFYSSLLIKNGGIIIIDDALHHGVSKCIKYIISNYKNFKKIESSQSIAIFIKNGDDDRKWNFHVNF
jgi:predicted O-methyltransferase YrrM